MVLPKNVLDKCMRKFFNRKIITKPLLQKKVFTRKNIDSFAVFRCFIVANLQ